MKTIMRKILIMLISIILVLNIPTYSKAFSLDDIIGYGDSFISAGSGSNAQGISEDKIKDISDSVSNILLAIAVGVTLISISVMAINFIVQSVEDKAKIKESMVPWVVGIFVTFGAFGIWKITMGIFYKLL